MTAAPTASCCWPPARWRRATPQVQRWGQLASSASAAAPGSASAQPGALAHGHAHLTTEPCLPPPACPGCHADCLFMEASLVAADRMYTTKRQILEELGMGAPPRRAPAV